MRRPDALSLAAAHLPGHGEIELERLSAGPFNDTYRARRAGRQFTLRITREAAIGRAAREFEAALIRRAAAAGLAPSLAGGDAAAGVLILDWLPGEAWPTAALTQRVHIDAAAGLIRRIHALPVPVPVRSSSPADWVKGYQQALTGDAASPALAAAAERALAHLAALPAPVRVVCHSDLHRLNVLQPPAGGPAASVLLDWEYAHVSEPGWDLAGWSANNDFTAGQSRSLLAAYGAVAPTDLEWRRFGLLRWLYDYVCLLWVRLFRASLGGEGATLEARAERLQERLHAAVCGTLDDPDGHFFLEI